MPQLIDFRSMWSLSASSLSRHPAQARLAFVGVLAIIIIGMSWKYAVKVNKPGDGGQQTRSAFLRWRGMIHELFAGENIYIGVNEYPNPPIMAVILKPFVDLPPNVGAIAWFYAKVLMAILSAMWIFRLTALSQPTPISESDPSLKIDGLNNRDLARGVAILLALSPILGDLSHNNVNTFILFLIAGMIELYRRGWDIATGLVLGLAIACKVTPLLFVGYFFWKRSWTVLLATIAGLLISLVVVPSLALGFERNTELLESWYTLMIRPAIIENRITSEHPNQSLPGLIYRLLTHSPSFIIYPDNIPTAAAYHNFIDIGTNSARWLVKFVLAVFLLEVFYLCRVKRSDRQGLQFAAECSLIVLGMLLFSERTWKHHAVTLLLPFAVLTSVLFSPETSSQAKRWLSAALLSVAVLMLGTGILPQHAGDLAMVYGAYTATFAVLTMAIVAILAARRCQPEEQICSNHT